MQYKCVPRYAHVRRKGWLRIFIKKNKARAFFDFPSSFAGISLVVYLHKRRTLCAGWKGIKTTNEGMCVTTWSLGVLLFVPMRM